MLKKLTLVSLFASGSLYADTILGGEISIGAYNHSPSGTASYTLPYTTLHSAVDMENDFGWNDEQDLMLKAYLEHPLPMVPNIRIAYTGFNQTGEATVNAFSWGNIMDLDGAVDTSLELDMYDFTAYYELLDNVVELDAGITLRYLTGNITVDTVADSNLPSPLPSASVPLVSESTDLDLWLPLLYGKARFNIPTTDVSLQLEGNGLSYEDTTFYDFELSARYTFAMGLGVEAGFKSMHLDSQDLAEGLIIDVDVSGVYASVVLDF